MKTEVRNGYVNIIEIPLDEIKKIDFDICKEPKETVGAYYDRQEIKPDVVCNAGFFAMSNGNTVFNYMDDGEVVSSQNTFRWGIGTIDDKTLAYGCVDDGTKYKDFMCGYPVLLDAGEIQELSYTSEINSRNPRTAFGYNTESVFIVLVDGRQLGKPGMSMQELAAFMQSLGCDYAINLDGGGSSRCLVNGEVFNDPIENRAVDSVLAIYLNKNADNKVIVPEVGDVVKFTGGKTYSSSLGGTAKDREPSYCKLTKKVSAKYGYHLKSLAGQPSVYGWTKPDAVEALTTAEETVINLYHNGIIDDMDYWLNVINELTPLSVDVLNKLLAKINDTI